jgi:hypothetical protein
MNRFPLVSCGFLAVFIRVTASLHAESLADYPDYRDLPVRTTDTRLATLVRDGVRFSSTFQALTERLSESDLIVYLVLDTFAPDGLDGRLTFVTSTQGARYVLIRVAFYAEPARQIAIIGHELQHAVEIADAPSVVDEESLSREYGRIGHSHSTLPSKTKMFDTDAAVKTGERVFRELAAGNGY